MNESIFGYKAHLVLEDEDGTEFEVREFLDKRDYRSIGLNEVRISDAIDAYEASKVPQKRPVF